jgi:hypothetical protein
VSVVSARRATALALAVAALLAVVAGCASDGLANGASAVDKAAASAAPTDPTAGLLDGPQLKSFLLTAADVPVGYRPAAAYTRDSGAVLAAAGPVVPGADAVGCASLTTTGFLSQLPGPNSASFAQDEFDDPSDQAISSEVDDYRGTDAATIMTAFLKRLSDCATFLDKADPNQPTYHVSTQAGPAIGDDSVQFEITSSSYLGGETGVVVRVGNLLVSVFHSTTRAGATGATAYGDAAKVAGRIVAAIGPAHTAAP